MAGVTNRGKALMMQVYFQNATENTAFYMALCDDSITPNADINTLSQLGEVPAGNGYLSGGLSIARDNVDFTVAELDDPTNKATLTIKDLVWTADQGNLPASGNGARWAALTTDEVTVGNRQVVAFFDLGANRIVSDTQTLTLQACKIDLTE